MGRNELPDGIESLAENAKFVGDGMKVDEWTAASVWTPDELEVSENVEIVNQTVASGNAPAVDKAEVEGWDKYELRR